MIVYINHKNWTTSSIFDRIEDLNEKEKITPQIYRMLTWGNDHIQIFLNWLSKKFEIRFVHVSGRDLWSLDYTMSHVILAGLISFKEKNIISIPFVDCEDVPEDMSYEAHNIELHEAPNDLLEERWQYVLDQMIESFILISDDNFSNLRDGEIVDQGLRMFGKYYRNLWI